MMRLLLVGSMCLFLGCNPFSYKEKELVGKWQAVLLVQEQDTLNYDISRVALEFHEDQRYSYQSNLAEREAGNYYLLGKILYTKDTTVTSPTEKAVQIELLTQDSMRLLMRSSAGLQRLDMVRAE